MHEAGPIFPYGFGLLFLLIVGAGKKWSVHVAIARPNSA
jgi:hypothetical protein